MQREAHSFCRICPGFCGVKVSLDGDRITAVHGDKQHPITAGYICSKANLAVEMHHGPQRLLRPLKRQDDGALVPIALETALDEIAVKLRGIIDRDGADAVAVFRGTANGLNTAATWSAMGLLAAIGSTSNYSTMTIDQSAKWVTNCRLGAWDAGRQHMDHSDVLMMFGTNPLVSLLGGLNNFVPLNPVKRIKDAKARGMKLIVIDPRYTETARHADIFLQPYPGEDPTLAAGMLHLVFANHWEDSEFCAQYAHGVDSLRAAVAPFTPAYVAQRAGVPQDQFVAAVQMFAEQSRTGAAASGTGPSMAPRSNLADHLIECLNVICGRFPRAGDPVANPGAMSAPASYRAEVVAPTRPWESGVKSRIRNTGTVYGERMSGILADEILTPGAGQLKAVISAAANPASALPDQTKAVAALKALELLVAVEPFMTTTAQLAHYILPTKLLYERCDIPPTQFYERTLYSRPFAQFAHALIPPPAGSEVVDDWYIYWSLAKRLGVTLTIAGAPLDMNVVPTTEDIIAILLRNAPTKLDDMRAHPEGVLRDDITQTVAPSRPDHNARFDVMPDDVAAELREVATESIERNSQRRYLLTARRVREVVNTTGHGLTEVRRRHPFNVAYVHPDDLSAEGLGDGDDTVLQSDYAEINAVVKADETMRRGVIAMTHGWGGLPDESGDDPRAGVCTNRLVRTDRHVEVINAMPAMTAIPISIGRRH